MAFFVAVAAFTLALDQWSKAAVRQHLLSGQTHALIPGWVHLVYVQNGGAAWSMLSGRRIFLLFFTGLVTLVVAAFAREMVARGKLAAVGWGLILGGALGNMADRLLLGKVTDFIQMDTPWRVLSTFPTFNLADSALTVGVLCMLLGLWLEARRSKPGAAPGL